VEVFETDNGERVTSPLRHNGLPWGVQFRPVGRQLATASPNEALVRLWDLPSERLAALGFPHQRDVIWAGFSPDGRQILTASRDGTARLWDATFGRPLLFALEHSSAPNCPDPAFSRDGNRLLIANTEHTVETWDLGTGQPLVLPLEHPSPVRHAEFSPDGTSLITSTASGSVQLWDAATGEALGPDFPRLRERAYACFSPDGRRVATIGMAFTPESHARVWDVATGRALTPVMQGKLGAEYSAAFSPDGNRLLTCACNGGVRIWDSHTGRLITPLADQSDSPV
jgi:WD40 repeat protein